MNDKPILINSSQDPAERGKALSRRIPGELMKVAKNKHYHFIGIGGIGMSALARLALSSSTVSGSDIAASYVTDDLEKLGVEVQFGHKKENIPQKAIVVYSTMINKDNEELKSARELGLPIYHRSDLLAELMQNQKSLLVAGTHGKTTTSSLLASVLIESEFHPTWVVGGIVSQYKSNGGLGSGEFFVAEADESDGTHLKYTPSGAIVTNIDLDHMDFYQTEEKLIASFQAFTDKVQDPSLLFYCGDDQRLQNMNLKGVSYGFGEHNQLKILHFRQNGKTIVFDAQWGDKSFFQIELNLMGRHNALNGIAVFGLALQLNVPEERIRAAFKTFGGCKRRLELKSSSQSIMIFDDYGHHPQEVQATLKAIRKAYPYRRLIVAFQPHRYTRTRDCFDEFPEAFEQADLLYLTDIYSASETPIEGITGERFYENVKKHAAVPTLFVHRGELDEAIYQNLRPFDLVVTMGAGDITKVSDHLRDRLIQQPVPKLKAGVIFGGRSHEHEVTYLSARFVASSFDPELFDKSYFVISKQGVWRTGADVEKLLDQGTSFETSQKQPLSPQVLESLQQCDVVFPVLHGTFGEDGTIQGMLEMLNIAYVGCDVVSSAIAMNKAHTKKLCLAAGLPVVPFTDFTEYEWKNHADEILAKIDSQLQFPLFIKPVHLGSTVGVKKVTGPETLRSAVQEAFHYDNHLIVENAVRLRELEVSVLGFGFVEASQPGEICANGEVYSKEGKYSSTKGTPTKVVADLEPLEAQKAKQLAIDCYRAIGGSGMARVDIFLDLDTGEFLLNEINPIPGFTQNSLYPLMCKSSGIEAQELINRLVMSAFKKKESCWRI